MIFTWDEEKRKKNIEKHNLDFVFAEKIFDTSKGHDFIDNRFDYGEERHLHYAEIDGVKVCLCYVTRKDEMRIISLRRVHDKEWRKYYDN